MLFSVESWILSIAEIEQFAVHQKGLFNCLY